MRLLIGNIVTEVIIGGKDNLLKINIAKELDDYLKVKDPGAYWAQKGGSKWDGYRHFFTGTKFPTGFLGNVLNFLEKDLGVTLEIQDLRANVPVFSETFESEWGPHVPRPYQIDLVKKVNHSLDWSGGKIYFPRGVIDAATNAGKNLITLGLINNIVGARCLFLIHNKSIYQQAVDYFSPYLEVGQVNDKYYKLTDFTVAMVKSLLIKSEKSVNVLKDLNTFNMVIVDEGHKAGGAEYSKLLKRINAGCRLIISGTPLANDNKINNLTIIGIAGKVLGKVSNQELIDQKVSLRPVVEMHFIETKLKLPCLSYDEEDNLCIQFSEERNEKIKEIVEARPDKQILICFNDIPHGFAIYNKLKHIDNVAIVHGEDFARNFKIKDFASGKIRVLISSTILKEGMNIPNIQALIYAIGGKSEITVKQFVGRALRNNNDGEEIVEVHDFYDTGKHIAKHSRDRMRIYKKEGFEIKEHYDKSKTRKTNVSRN